MTEKITFDDLTSLEKDLIREAFCTQIQNELNEGNQNKAEMLMELKRKIVPTITEISDKE